MKNTRGVVIGVAAIVLSAIFFLVPFLFSFVIASMDRTQANQLQFTWPQPFVLLDNIREALAARDYLMVIAFINSIILTVTSVAALVIFSAMVAYIWQRRASRWSPVVNILVLAGLIVPPAIVPTIWVLQTLGLFRTMPGLILHRDRLRTAVLHPAVPRLHRVGATRAGRSCSGRRGRNRADLLPSDLPGAAVGHHDGDHPAVSAHL